MCQELSVCLFVLATLKCKHLCIIFYQEIVQKRQQYLHSTFGNGQMQTQKVSIAASNLPITKQAKYMYKIYIPIFVQIRA